VILRLATLAAMALFGAGLAAATELPTLPEPSQAHQHYSVVGMASWYGADFHGRPTANGETFNMWSLSAANRTMPLPSYARVTNLRNGRSIVVRVNDRGPFAGGRILDVSARVATLLEFGPAGVAKVKIDYLGKAPAPGSDGPALLASLQMGGAPAPASLVKLAGSDRAATSASLKTGGAPAPATLVKLAGFDGPAAAASLKTDGAPAPATLVKLAGFDGPAPSASPQTSKPLTVMGVPTPLAGSKALLISLQTSGPAAAEPVPLVVRAAADEGVTVIERAVERRPAAESRSPYGDLISSPFLVQAAARP
jgi:rare lipoprotein A